MYVLQSAILTRKMRISYLVILYITSNEILLLTVILTVYNTNHLVSKMFVETNLAERFAAYLFTSVLVYK